MKTIERAEAAKLVHEGFGMTHGQRAALQKERLKELVAYARERSPLLKEMYGNLPEDFSLEDLPVMEKKAMTARYDEWVTDPEIRRPAVEAFCDRDASDGSLFLDQYTVLHTSGTTAKPMYMVRDGHRNAIHSQLMAQRLMNGVDPGLMNPTVHRTAAVIYAVHGSSSYEGFLRTQRAIPGFEGNMRAVSILNSIREIADELNGFQPEVLSGYGSVLPMLAVEKEAGRLNIPVKVIFNSAEGLSPENFLRVQKAFGCPVKNNYCMTEGGEIAMTVDGPDLLLNPRGAGGQPDASRSGSGGMVRRHPGDGSFQLCPAHYPVLRERQRARRTLPGGAGAPAEAGDPRAGQRHVHPGGRHLRRHQHRRPGGILARRGGFPVRPGGGR